jgi:repressor LexA
MRKITIRQKEVFDFLYKYTGRENRPPTLMDIKKHFGFASNQGVVDHLKALEKKGYIKRLKRSRGIVILKNDPFPILGRIAAGNPIMAEEFHEGNLNLEELFDAEGCYVIRVKGDSMKNVGILDGDYAIVRYQETIENGEICVAIVDDEATIKRILFKSSKVILQPENELYEPIIITAKSDLKIRGRVVGVLRKF